MSKPLIPLNPSFIRKIGALTLAAALFTGAAAQTPASAVGTTSAKSSAAVHNSSLAKQAADFQDRLTAEYSAFLEHYYGISFQDTVAKGDFLQAVFVAAGLQAAEEQAVFSDLANNHEWYEAINALYQEGILAEGAVDGQRLPTVVEAAAWIVKAAGLKELAYTYSEDKVQRILQGSPVQYNNGRNGLTLSQAQEWAAAVDNEIIPAELFKNVRSNTVLTGQWAAILIGKLVEYKGEYKNYVGHISDADIARKVLQAWQSIGILSSDELTPVVDSALQQDLVTGYNMKDIRFTPKFDPELSITYGHSDITHALQLIGLIKSEEIDAKVQLEPKTSAFIYLSEWGTPTETPDYQVKQIANGNYIAYSKEYDLSFEFESGDEKARFDEWISTYAKKDSEDTTGLLLGSWWQPLYYSYTELEGFPVISNQYIQSGNYLAQSFSLLEDSESVIAAFKEVAPDLEVNSYTFWVDQPFYNYLRGESK
ncbi:S-layer homology domain-containing protein [Paenibacillus senegalensis]|uniref:S-layer homology domain-containing protein n=1 Tax=Paenibacillus senegalensis TaxID=1465766 RepID=UPI0002893C81|nr:S-layer homology domain-containing protein [Paenibacillus senegalensis]